MIILYFIFLILFGFGFLTFSLFLFSISLDLRYYCEYLKFFLCILFVLIFSVLGFIFVYKGLWVLQTDTFKNIFKSIENYLNSPYLF